MYLVRGSCRDLIGVTLWVWRMSRFVNPLGAARFDDMSVVELDSKLVPIADSLISRSNGSYDASFVRDLVATIAADFDGVPVRDYVDVLIAKEAMDEMRRLNALNLVTS